MTVDEIKKKMGYTCTPPTEENKILHLVKNICEKYERQYIAFPCGCYRKFMYVEKIADNDGKICLIGPTLSVFESDKTEDKRFTFDQYSIYEINPYVPEYPQITTKAVVEELVSMARFDMAASLFHDDYLAGKVKFETLSL